jgi:hypothetical protein
MIAPEIGISRMPPLKTYQYYVHTISLSGNGLQAGFFAP